jgi:hypothetical protein
MRIKTTVGVAALLMCSTMANQAAAGFFRIVPPPTPPVPEFDGPGGIAAAALLVSVVAVLFNRSRNG